MTTLSDDGLCSACGGHGSVMDGSRQVTGRWRERTVPNMVRCGWCDGRDRVTPLVEAQADV